MNRLSSSLSPYLLQHQNNPVDWYPWGEEAFEKARQADLPVFLSVGYAACHWCHVMEHESFENAAIAEFLNKYFVSIKVDREERPDIDQIYMNSVQLMTGRGGWPMSVFLNHQKQPFYAGTYWPPSPQRGMPGFAQILDALADAWQNRRSEVQQHAAQVTSSLGQLALGVSEPAATMPGDEVIRDATNHLLKVLDRERGGFGSAPKFPHATDLDLLLRRGQTKGDKTLINAAELTLDAMAAGGIRDHIGGGFARYSVDARWLVPHFEKMLYDNTLLAEVYVRAFQVTGHERHADVAKEILDYLAREMCDPSGGFHCSEDADSEGVEGKYYVWTVAEVISVLGSERGGRFCQIYDITESGNFEGKNIPNLPKSIADWASELGVPDLAAELAIDRDRLREQRSQRVRPGRDDKILASWNALAIRAFAIAGGVFDRPDYIATAERSATFMLEKMTSESGRLYHAFRQGDAHLDAYVDDYAYTAEAFVALFEATGLARWVGRASKLADTILKHFEDSEVGGFFYTADDAEALIARTKDWHDGSVVSGNASATMALLELSRLTGTDTYRDAAERTLQLAAPILKTQAAACAALLSSLDRMLHDHQQWVLAVPDGETMAAWRKRFLGPYRPHATLSWVIGQAPESGPVASLNQHREVIDGKPTLYRCQNFSCDRPLTGDDVTIALRGD
ncbi:thioredoxin domain-containing protein [Novipirellula caenicola]|uniref:Spermatogenesis-associated protein 20-like TRX domain-containing protein n=1 Tax=Novipirellula caenicola TaxID=1536901 RepID=A0ABP9VNP6_9BACT